MCVVFIRRPFAYSRSVLTASKNSAEQHTIDELNQQKLNATPPETKPLLSLVQPNTEKEQVASATNVRPEARDEAQERHRDG